MEGRILKAVLDSTSAVKEDNTVLRKQLVGVLNILYPFIASNPAFNCVNGTGESTLSYDARRKRADRVKSESRILEPKRRP